MLTLKRNEFHHEQLLCALLMPFLLWIPETNLLLFAVYGASNLFIFEISRLFRHFNCTISPTYYVDFHMLEFITTSKS